jgi:hypothetical protein
MIVEKSMKGIQKGQIVAPRNTTIYYRTKRKSIIAITNYKNGYAKFYRVRFDNSKPRQIEPTRELRLNILLEA